MREQELNTLLSIVTEPVNNVYKLDSRSAVEEIQRMVRIFNIANEQQNTHKMFSIKNLATMKLVMSNN